MFFSVCLIFTDNREKVIIFVSYEVLELLHYSIKNTKNIPEYALQKVTITCIFFEMLAILECFFKIVQQFIGIMTTSISSEAFEK